MVWYDSVVGIVGWWGSWDEQIRARARKGERDNGIMSL